MGIFRDVKGKLHREKSNNEFVPTIIMKNDNLTELNLRKLSDHLYIDQDSNMIYVDDENNYLTQVSVDNAVDDTNFRDAVGTPYHGTFNRNYWVQTEAPTITTITTENELEKRLKELESKLAKTVSLVHNCANCGATLEVEENKPVIHCKYCGSTYIVGTARIYSNY